MKNKHKDVMNIMKRVNRKLFTVNENSDDSLIGRGQINILEAILDNKKITQEQLAQILNLDKTTIAKAVKKLEEKGLIIRERSNEDRRKNEISATEKAFVVKEQMSKHMEDYTQSFFEGINENEIDSFKETLEKIETNIERKRTIMNDKKHAAIKIIKIIEENKSITLLKLTELLGKDEDHVSKMVKKLIAKGFIEESGGTLSVSQMAKEHKLNHKEEHREHRKDKEHKLNHKEEHGVRENHKDKKKHKEVFKEILNNNGISKDELIEKTGIESDEMDSLIKHFEKKGVVELKDGQLFADKSAMMKKSQKAK